MRDTTLLHATAPLALLVAAAGCSSSSASRGSTDGGASDDGSSVTPRDASGADAPRDEAGDDASDLDAGSTDGPASGAGRVVFLLPDAGWSAIEARAGASPLALEGPLNAVAPGADEFVSIAHDGVSLAAVGSRFGCATDDCVTVAVAAATSGAEVIAGGAVSRAAGRATVGGGGTLVVYPATGGPHTWDLYATTKSGAAWSAPTLLTAASTADYQHDPALSADLTKVVFVCGTSQYQTPGSSICEAAIDGSGTSVVVAVNAGPGATTGNITHHPDYAPDGSIVFEADWGGSERIWRRATSGALTLISPPTVSDDNSPCVLPDGRIASLWLGRPGNADNVHELKVMDPDGANGTMLVTGVDIVDVGESCGD